jgi:hypothetical protein
MMIERRLLEALDAARPNSDDLEQPDLTEFQDASRAVREDAVVAKARDHIQRFDQAIGAAMDEVAVPGDLASRLLAAAEAAAAAESAPPVEQGALLELAEQSVERSESRRAWLLGIPLSVAAALAVVIGMRAFAPAPQPMSIADASELAVNWFDELQRVSGDLQPMSEAPEELRISSYVNASPQGYRRLMPAADPSAESEQLASVNEVIAYELQRRGRRVTLFAFRADVEGLDDTPPRLPTSDSGGITIGLWQESGVVYALVVPKGLGDYAEFIKAVDLG